MKAEEIEFTASSPFQHERRGRGFSYLLPAQGKKKKEGASDKASEDLTLAQQWRVFAKDKSGTELAGFDNLQHSSRQKAEA